MSPREGRCGWLRWGIGAVVLLVVLAVAVPYVYIHFIQGPAPKQLSLTPETSPSGGTLTAEQVDGTWKVSSGSQAGYRVKEVLAGQNNTAVGRGTGVTGSFRIANGAITGGSFDVDLRTITSDSGQRDGQFNGRIMDTAQFPTATFTLTAPVSLGSLPTVGQTISLKADGSLAMHGVTKPVTATMHARDDGSSISISGEIPVAFGDWNIANPSFGSFVKTADDGLVEFLLKTAKG
jgi:polyisoprenoid-binding protein YceI